jgi:hypothetical protein
MKRPRRGIGVGCSRKAREAQDMARPVLKLIAGLLLLAPGAALAQAGAEGGSGQVVATAPPAQPTLSKPHDQVASVSEAAAAESLQDDGPVRDNRVHGEVSIGVGTNGYRQFSGVATAPIGDVGQATVAIDSEQYNYRRR